MDGYYTFLLVMFDFLHVPSSEISSGGVYGKLVVDIDNMHGS